MKHLKLALAVASVLAAANASAFAPVWPADGDDAAGVDPVGGVVLWHSGASASNTSVQDAVVSAFCDPAQAVDVLESPGSVDHWAVACIGKATLSANLAAKRIIWNKRNEGGSGVGVQPVLNNVQISFMKPSTGAGNNCPTQIGTRAYVSGTVIANLWPCSGFAVPVSINEADPATDAVVRIPDLGTADLEADKFAFAENISASDLNLDSVRPDALNPAVVAGSYDQADLGQLVFGVYGGLKMYQALQAVQFPAGHALFNKCNPAGTDYLLHRDGVTGAVLINNLGANANSENCMASLSSSEIRSIFGNARAIRVAGDFQAETAVNGVYASLVAAGTTDQTIMVCRRVKGSGTQAQFNANLMGYPCDATTDGTIDSLTPAGQGGLTPNIIENEASGDLDLCVDDFNDGTNVGLRNAGLATRWSIGLGSTERNTNLSLNFRYFKIDDRAPTLVNVHGGEYTDYAQQVLLKRSAANAVPATAVVNDAYAALTPALSTAAAMGSLGRTHSWGRAGWLAVPSLAPVVTPTSELSFTAPINAFRKVSGTNKPNTCAPPSAFRPASGAVDVTVGPQNCSGENPTGDQNCYTP